MGTGHSCPSWSANAAPRPARRTAGGHLLAPGRIYRLHPDCPARHQSCSARSGARTAGRHAGQPFGNAQHTGRLCSSACHRFRYARCGPGTGHGACRGRHRHRQDTWISGPGHIVGGKERGGGVDFNLHPYAAASGGIGTDTPVSRSDRMGPQSGDSQRPRKLSVSSQS